MANTEAESVDDMVDASKREVINGRWMLVQLMPDLMRYEVKHSYILELKYLSVKDTEEKTRTQWQEAVKQINEYAAAPRVRQLVQNTKLHCIIIQFRGWELERMEEV